MNKTLQDFMNNKHDTNFIDSIGGLFGSMVAADQFFHVLNGFLAAIIGLLTIFWFGVRIYDRFFNKSKK